MERDSVLQITAITRVMPEGQKCVAATIRYEFPPAMDQPLEGRFQVEGRKILSAHVQGNQVVLELDPQDPGADTYFPGNPWQAMPARIEPAQVTVTQCCPIQGANHQLLPAFGPRENNAVENELVDDFIQGEEDGVKYNLFIPRNIQPQERYPLVQFIHDGSVCGPDPRLTLAQGLGAVIWTAPEEQKRHPCFVFAPQFDGESIVDDEGNVSPRLEVAKKILDRILERYPVDRGRVYTTGQSMGCMASIVWNVRYPQYFAASFLVAGQWNERSIPGLENQHLWMLNSQGDAKSFPGMNQMCVAMEHKGGKVVHRVVDAGLSQEEYNQMVEDLVKTGANVLCTHYRLETVADGWHSNGGEHHVHTWRTAYSIQAIRDWLFTIRKGADCERN